MQVNMFFNIYQSLQFQRISAAGICEIFPAAPFQIGLNNGMDFVYRLSSTQRYLLTVEKQPTLSADGKVDQPFSKWRGVLLMILPLVIYNYSIPSFDESRWADVPC
jgi:hypothetical protein